MRAKEEPSEAANLNGWEACWPQYLLTPLSIDIQLMWFRGCVQLRQSGRPGRTLSGTPGMGTGNGKADQLCLGDLGTVIAFMLL